MKFYLIDWYLLILKLMKNFIKILILIFAFYSCSKDNIIDNTNKINSDIKVTLIEELSKTQNILNINSETIEIQPCINTSLLTKYEQIGNKIVIDYEGISTPNVCLTALGPAITGYSYNLEKHLSNYQVYHHASHLQLYCLILFGQYCQH